MRASRTAGGDAAIMTGAAIGVRPEAERFGYRRFIIKQHKSCRERRELFALSISGAKSLRVP